MCYDYKQLMTDIELIKKNYDFTECFSIGKSVMGRDIPCVKIGAGRKKIMLAGAYHGLEYITSAFLMRFLEGYITHFLTARRFFDRKPSHLYSGATLYILPMINPDGVDIAANGIDITNPHHRKLIQTVGIQDFKSGWQANANGVDLNHNFDAKWESVLDAPAPSRYGGEFPESEPETKAVVSFTRRESFDMLLAFHSQGSEIYYNFDGMYGKNSMAIVKKMADESGYRVCHPTGTAAYGGCKDWFIREFGRDGFTIEVGMGKNPLPMSDLDKIYEANSRIIMCAIEG